MKHTFLEQLSIKTLQFIEKLLCKSFLLWNVEFDWIQNEKNAMRLDYNYSYHNRGILTVG